MKAFRSFGILGAKDINSKVSQSDPLLPVASSSRTVKASKSIFPLRRGKKRPATSEDKAATIAKRKRAKYAHVRPPPPLANELALMQFADGGKIDSHVQRLMEAQAKAAAGSSTMNVGVADVYRDGKGGIWWDEEEEMEYVHLLDGVDKKRAEKQAEEVDWENFEVQQQHKENVVTVGPLFDRRRSASVSSMDSEHNPQFLLEAEERPTFTTGTPNDRILASSKIGGANMSALSLPSRPKQLAPHLVRSLAPSEMEAFGEEATLPVRRSLDAIFAETARPKGPARRRPSNLTLSPTSGATFNVPISAPHDGRFPRSTSLRHEFLQDSFTPPPSQPPTRTTTPVVDSVRYRKMKTAPSVLSIRSLFVRKSTQTA
ncbi:hypothetical protein CPB83DRAFT_858662 [Crepidotus variabilis]|uniref:Uncharacterized protein n=1 Tax=Crepidotus variabilis TaxID=179855 RepID=A0A9P6EBD9_9AGAR|nr:hypothetical protein CPB83DRAFT_858662 [Crepidotus variabilis]